MLDPTQLNLDLLGQVTHAIDRRQPGPALEPRGEGLDQELRTAADADPACRTQGGLTRRGTADQDQALRAGAQHVRNRRNVGVSHSRAFRNGRRVV